LLCNGSRLALDPDAAVSKSIEAEHGECNIEEADEPELHGISSPVSAVTSLFPADARLPEGARHAPQSIDPGLAGGFWLLARLPWAVSGR